MTERNEAARRMDGCGRARVSTATDIRIVARCAAFVACVWAIPTFMAWAKAMGWW